MALLGLDTYQKKGIFFSYMLLWSALRLLTYGSKRAGGSTYNETSLLVFVCCAKLAIATGMYIFNDGSFSALVAEASRNSGLFLRYALPALSYVIYDNLTFVNLTHTDPVTYVILMQMRIVATGATWSAFFGKALNRNQWTAIGLITAACVLKETPRIQAALGHGSGANGAGLLTSIQLIAFQIACGVFSSVFNELLLKEKGSAGVNLQNIFMYTHSILFNVAWLAVCPSPVVCKGPLSEAVRPENLAQLLQPVVLPIGLILATIGIVTSLFIKHLDSVRKTIASAIEIFVDAVLAFVLFNIPLDGFTLCAAALAAGGVIYYSKPVEEPLLGD